MLVPKTFNMNIFWFGPTPLRFAKVKTQKLLGKGEEKIVALI